jgi:hypothetical protein
LFYKFSLLFQCSLDNFFEILSDLGVFLDVKRVGFVLKKDFSISRNIDSQITIDTIDDEFTVFLCDLTISEKIMSDFFHELSGDRDACVESPEFILNNHIVILTIGGDVRVCFWRK